MGTKSPDSVTALAVPLAPTQIEAAQKLYKRLRDWRASNEALVVLGEKFPGFDFPAVLLKAVAINQLYSTNIYAIVPMARHLQGTRRGAVSSPSVAGPDEIVGANEGCAGSHQ